METTLILIKILIKFNINLNHRLVKVNELIYIKIIYAHTNICKFELISFIGGWGSVWGGIGWGGSDGGSDGGGRMGGGGIEWGGSDWGSPVNNSP